MATPADESPSNGMDNKAAGGGGGGGDKSPDNVIAKAAGAVIASGIAWSVFKVFWPKKSSVEEEVDIIPEEASSLEGEVKEKAEELSEKTGSSIARRFPNFSRKSKSQPYEVCYGDTLYGISRKYNVSVDAIKAANGLTTDFILEGDKLNIPS